MITSDAPLIRSDHETGLFTKQALAEKYHVHPDTITNVLTRCEDQDIYVNSAEKLHSKVFSGQFCPVSRKFIICRKLLPLLMNAFIIWRA